VQGHGLGVGRRGSVQYLGDVHPAAVGRAAQPCHQVEVCGGGDALIPLALDQRLTHAEKAVLSMSVFLMLDLVEVVMSIRSRFSVPLCRS